MSKGGPGNAPCRSLLRAFNPAHRASYAGCMHTSSASLFSGQLKISCPSVCIRAAEYPDNRRVAAAFSSPAHTRSLMPELTGALLCSARFAVSVSGAGGSELMPPDHETPFGGGEAGIPSRLRQAVRASAASASIWSRSPVFRASASREDTAASSSLCTAGAACPGLSIHSRARSFSAKSWANCRCAGWAKPALISATSCSSAPWTWRTSQSWLAPIARHCLSM